MKVNYIKSNQITFSLVAIVIGIVGSSGSGRIQAARDASATWQDAFAGSAEVAAGFADQ